MTMFTEWRQKNVHKCVDMDVLLVWIYCWLHVWFSKDMLVMFAYLYNVHVYNWYGYVWQKVGEFVFHLNLRFDFKF